jgi:hypothetical protein
MSKGKGKSLFFKANLFYSSQKVQDISFLISTHFSFLFLDSPIVQSSPPSPTLREFCASLIMDTVCKIEARCSPQSEKWGEMRNAAILEGLEVCTD